MFCLVLFFSISIFSFDIIDWIDCTNEENTMPGIGFIGLNNNKAEIDIIHVKLNKEHFNQGETVTVSIKAKVTSGSIGKNTKIEVFILQKELKMNPVPYRSKLCDLLNDASTCPLSKDDIVELEWSKKIPLIKLEEETLFTGKCIVKENMNVISCLKFNFYIK